MEQELNIFGLYLTDNPVTEFKNKYKNVIDLNEIETYFDKNIDIIVYVDKIKEVNTSKGDKMCFISGSDELSQIDIVLFPKIYQKYNNLNHGDIVKISGKVEKRFDKYQIVTNKIEIL